MTLTLKDAVTLKHTVLSRCKACSRDKNLLQHSFVIFSDLTFHKSTGREMTRVSKIDHLCH